MTWNMLVIVDGQQTLMTECQYRILRMAEQRQVVKLEKYRGGKKYQGWKLRDGEPVTATTRCLIRKKYLRVGGVSGKSVSLTPAGKRAMLAYAEKMASR